MDEKDILKDNALEEFGLIKEIDTLSIILEAQKIKEKKKNFLVNILGFITAFIMISVNLIVFFTIGYKFFALTQVLVSWVIS